MPVHQIHHRLFSVISASPQGEPINPVIFPKFTKVTKLIGFLDFFELEYLEKMEKNSDYFLSFLY